MKTVRWIGIAILFFLAVSAIIGGIPMIADPLGTPWNMQPGLLQHSPFSSFLFPGIALLIANGLLALWVLGFALARLPRHGLWITFQGCILLGWLAIECVMLRLVSWPHYLYGAVALGLIAAGLLLSRGEKRPTLFGNRDGI